MDSGEMAYRDTVARGMRKFAQQNNQRLHELDQRALRYAQERDDISKLLDEAEDELDVALKQVALYKQHLDAANANIVKMNASYAELKEYAEEQSEGCEELVGISLDKDRIIDAKNAEIAALKDLLAEHGISTEPSGGMKP